MGRRTRQGSRVGDYSGTREPSRTRPQPRQFDKQPDPSLQKAKGGAMKNLGYDRPLYLLPFDHRSSFDLTMFGWGNDLTPEQPPQITPTKQAIYDGFKPTTDAGPTRDKPRILPHNQVGATIVPH